MVSAWKGIRFGGLRQRYVVGLVASTLCGIVELNGCMP